MHENNIFGNDALLNEEFLMEGGNAIEAAEPIESQTAQMIGQNIISKLKSRFGDSIRMELQGSILSKRPGEMVGDIDILMDLKYSEPEKGQNIREIEDIRDFINDAFPNSEVVIQQGTLKNIISFGYVYDEDGHKKVAQVDIKITNNFDWTKAIGNRSMNSTFKDALRKILLKTIAGQAPYNGENPEQYENEYFTDQDFVGKNGEPGKFAGELKGEWRYTMDDELGLFHGHRFRDGKTKPLSRHNERLNKDFPRMASFDQKNFITDEFSSALKTIMGPEVTSDDVDSVESIIKFLFSGRYAYADKDRLQRIKENVIQELERSNRNLPEDTVDKFIEMWDYYSTQNSNSQQLQECNNFALTMRNLMNRMQLL